MKSVLTVMTLQTHAGSSSLYNYILSSSLKTLTPTMWRRPLVRDDSPLFARIRPRMTTVHHTATIKQTRAHRYTDNTLSGGHGTTRRPSVLRHDVYPSRGSCSPLITVSHGDSTVGLGDGPDRRFPPGLNANRACVAASGLIYCRANNWNLFPHVANTSTMVASIIEVKISVREHQEIPLLFPQIKSKETDQSVRS